MSAIVKSIAGQKSTFQFENESTTAVINSVSTDTYSFTTLDQFLIDNTSNTHDVWLKVYNVVSPTLGTTQPYVKIKCPAGAVQRVTTSGLVINPIAWVCTKEGNYSKSTDPDSGVGVTILAH